MRVSHWIGFTPRNPTSLFSCEEAKAFVDGVPSVDYHRVIPTQAEPEILPPIRWPVLCVNSSKGTSNARLMANGHPANAKTDPFLRKLGASWGPLGAIQSTNDAPFGQMCIRVNAGIWPYTGIEAAFEGAVACILVHK